MDVDDPAAELADARAGSMCCQIRCDGSKFRPNAGLGISPNIRRQTAGDMARFLPPGHSSFEKSIGQFSMPIFTPACLGVADQVGPDAPGTSASCRRSTAPVAADEGVDHADAEPGRGRDHLPQMVDDLAAVLRVRVERVGIVAEAGDGDAVDADEVADAVGLVVVEAG